MRRWIAWVAVGIAFGCPAFAQSRLGRGDEIARQYRDALPHYDKAVKAYSRQDWENARRELDKAITAMPQYSYAHLLMAKSWYMSKRYDQALPAIERAETTWREFAALAAEGKSLQSDALVRRRRGLQDQIAAMNDDLRQPTNTAAQIAQIQTWIDQLKHEIDEIDREQASGVAPELATLPAEYSFIHGNILLRSNRLVDAEPQYLRAIEAKPDYGEAFNNLASLYYQAGSFDKARQVLQEARNRNLPINLDLERAVAANP
jgi:pentatricopeptide repeat protein